MNLRRTRRAAACTALALALAGCGAPGLPGSGGGTAPEIGAAVTDEQSARILDRVLTESRSVYSGEGDAAGQVPKTFAGEGARAALAAVQLVSAGVQGKAGAAPGDVKVLTTSRGDAYPRHIVGASTPAGAQLPQIHLISAKDAKTPYRLALSAQVLPGAAISAFPAPDQGAQVVTDGSDMAIKPVDLLKSYAKGLTEGAKGDVPYESDTFFDQVRQRAEEQAKAVAGQADFTQTNQVMPDPVVAVREANGDTLVFGAIERTSDYAIKAGQQMAPTPIFSAFVPGRSVLVQQVRTQAVQFLVFVVPKSGKAHLVAATEQVVGASGY